MTTTRTSIENRENTTVDYFSSMIDTLRISNTNETRMNSLIHPFSLYFLCNHCYGDEMKQYNIFVPEHINNILFSDNLSIIKDYDIIHVQVNYFSKFCNDILDRIDKKIIVTTGQFHRPQLCKNEQTDQILHHPNVLLWISQNPIYDNSNKYMAFPYGISPYNLEPYANFLLESNIVKKSHVCFLPINNDTHICRDRLPRVHQYPVNEFYRNMSESKFIISPIGDRDDCYRHYESIGVETIPISNVGDLYKSIFKENMFYCDIDEMLYIIKTNDVRHQYSIPNKNLICFHYYKEQIQNRILGLSASASGHLSVV